MVVIKSAPVTAPVMSRCGRVIVVRTESFPFGRQARGPCSFGGARPVICIQMKVLGSPEMVTLRSRADFLPFQVPIFGRLFGGKVTWITELAIENGEHLPHKSHLSLL